MPGHVEAQVEIAVGFGKQIDATQLDMCPLWVEVGVPQGEIRADVVCTPSAIVEPAQDLLRYNGHAKRENLSRNSYLAV